MSKETGSIKILNLYGKWYHEQKLDSSRKEEPNVQEFIADKINSELSIPELVKSSPTYNSIIKLLGLDGDT